MKNYLKICICALLCLQLTICFLLPVMAEPTAASAAPGSTSAQTGSSATVSLPQVPGSALPNNENNPVTAFLYIGGGLILLLLVPLTLRLKKSGSPPSGLDGLT